MVLNTEAGDKPRQTQQVIREKRARNVQYEEFIYEVCLPCVCDRSLGREGASRAGERTGNMAGESGSDGGGDPSGGGGDNCDNHGDGDDCDYPAGGGGGDDDYRDGDDDCENHSAGDGGGGWWCR